MKCLYILIAVFVINAEKGLADCDCHPKCTCSGTSVTCAGLTEMPECFPDGITELFITTSPDYRKLYENDIPSDSRRTLEYISFTFVGFRSMDSDAFKDMNKLKSLEISNCNYLDTLDFDSNSAPVNLQTLSVTNCYDLDTVSDIKFLPNLLEANFTNCDIRKIYESTFKGLSKLRVLLLNFNSRLYSISRRAFEDLYELEVLRFDYTKMDTLYPEYFESPFKLGNLKQVVTKGNYYKCNNMCSMTEWLGENPDFNDISDLGWCSASGDSYLIKNLDEDQAGCGLSGWAIFGIVMGCLIFGGLVAGGIAAYFLKVRKN